MTRTSIFAAALNLVAAAFRARSRGMTGHEAAALPQRADIHG